MKVSVCITVFNEEKTISKLLDSLLAQKKKPSEIVVVDAVSTDNTLKILRHYQKKDKRIKVLVQECSRARGRNLAVELAKNEITAMTDAGCVADKNWLKYITEPFKQKRVDIVAGFYEMKAQNPAQEAMRVYLGVLPDDFSVDFLPSTRSIAFRKKAFERLRGFPQKLDTAEDTAFNYKAVDMKLNIARVKKAKVEWGMPENLGKFFKKTKDYAKGDVISRIWKYPNKKYTSHNIKAIKIIFRYLAGLALLFLSLYYSPLLYVVLIIISAYLIFSFKKVLTKLGEIIPAIYGIILQITSDFAVMLGFISGLYETVKKGK
ncbi:MAG: glycosyltransferase [Candidatus Woesebacteria bacterium]|jgi:glycosyltransferase involved in cell wall biosynthesis